MPTERIIEGIGTSDGIVIGKAYLFMPIVGDDGFKVPEFTVAEDELDREAERLEAALASTREQIEQAQKGMAERAGLKHAKIFDAHLLLLEDPVLLGQVLDLVRTKRQNVEAAFSSVANDYLRVFAEIPDEYLRERAADVKDVVRRVLYNLVGAGRPSLAKLEEDVIVVAHDLAPSDTATMHRERVVGMVTEVGGPTSHTCIMARAMEIPAVGGVVGATEDIHDGDALIVDAIAGIVIIHPTDERIAEYEKKREESLRHEAQLLQLKDKPAVTTDDRRVYLLANIEIPEEAGHAIEQGAEGIGLYRTEFFFMNRQDLPSEDEQFEAYSVVARACGDRAVVIRTLDLGGDKFASSFNLPREMNPFLGWRAIRMCLERTDMFKAQLRAILRAGCVGNVRMMFPMISTVQEVRAAKELIEESKDELRREGREFDEHMRIGAMIEIPSAAMAADTLATEVDFFSIGTNDLIQYCLAIDRVNEKTAHMYDPMNLAVLRLLKTVINVAHNEPCGTGMGADLPLCPLARSSDRPRMKVCVCGEVAAHPLMAYLLVGLGVDELSTAAASIPQNKEIVRAMSYEKARQAAEAVLHFDDSADVKKLVREHVSQLDIDMGGRERQIEN